MTENTAGKQFSFDDLVEYVAPTGEEVIESTKEAEQTKALTLGNFSAHPGINEDDVFIPRLRLAQGLTNEVQSGEAKPGQWLMTGYPAKDELTIVPLLFNRHRELTDDEFRVVCRSTDSITGVGVPGGECAVCPLNQWTDGPKGKRVPPKCTFAYSYIVYVVEFNTIAMVDFKRTSIQAGKTLNTLTIQRGLGKFAVTMKSSARQGGKGTYYTAQIAPGAVPEETLKLARTLIGQ